MARNMNVQSNASEKVFVLAVLVGVDYGGASCCGYAWTCDFDRDGDGDDDGDVFALRWDCPPLRSQKGADPTQMASNMPQWNQAHRAHHQRKHGCIIANSLVHCEVRTIFHKKERERNMNQKTELPMQRAPPFPKIILRSSTSE